MNETIQEAGTNEWGELGTIIPRFHRNLDCKMVSTPRRRQLWRFGQRLQQCLVQDTSIHLFSYCGALDQAYMRYMCWINFPRCDIDLESARTCESSCINFFKSCGYAQGLWRCGPAKYFNGYEPEEPK